MIYISEKYLFSYQTRSNTTTISEVLSALIIDKYILNNASLLVGDNPNEKMPDIFLPDKSMGFEVTKCEAEIDFKHDDIQKVFKYIHNDYPTFQKIKNVNKYDEVSGLVSKNDFFKIKNLNLKIPVYNNIIVPPSMGALFHDKFWMKKSYLKSLENKLTKLNKNNYSGCENVSLIILSIHRMFNEEQAHIVKEIYDSVYKNYNKQFKNIYVFSMADIFLITNQKVTNLHHYKENEFNTLIEKMKTTLQIHEYQNISNNTIKSNYKN